MAIRVLPHNPSGQGLVDLKVNIPFAAPDGKELCLQLLKPWQKSDGRGYPLVVFIQGSSWTKPNQFWEIPQLSKLSERGFVVASVTHRSSAEAPAPAFLQDVKAAVRFLRANAEAYDIDKTRVCAWGTSSGGNTALLLGLTGDDPEFETDENAGESSAVQAVVDCFGPTDVTRMLNGQYAFLPRNEESTLYRLGAMNDDICDALLDKISPERYVQPGRDFPPFLILHGDADKVVLYEDSERMYNLLLDAGYEAELVRVTDAPHEGSFWSPALLEIIFDFIAEKLK